jgi:putative salt-induced outer membrane protein YdiY
MKLGGFVSVFILGVAALHGAPQIVYLDSGERLVGEIRAESTARTLVLDSALLGQLSLPRAKVVKIEPQEVAAPALERAVAGLAPSPETLVAVVEPHEAPAAADSVAVPLPVHPALREAKALLTNFSELESPSHWQGNLRIGLNLSDGDSKWAENYARGRLDITPEDSPNFFRFSGEYTYRKTQRANGQSFKSTDRYDGEFVYRRTVFEDWFVQNSMSVRVDQLKGIDRELKEFVGLGYKYKIGKDFEFVCGAGGGLRMLETEQDNYLVREAFALNTFQELSWSLSPRLKLTQNFDYNINPQASEQYNYILGAALRFRITELFGFEFSYSKNFDNDVGNGDSKEDVRWQNALVVYF